LSAPSTWKEIDYGEAGNRQYDLCERTSGEAMQEDFSIADGGDAERRASIGMSWAAREPAAIGPLHSVKILKNPLELAHFALELFFWIGIAFRIFTRGALMCRVIPVRISVGV